MCVRVRRVCWRFRKSTRAQIGSRLRRWRLYVIASVSARKGIKKGKKVKTIEQTTCSLLAGMGVRSLVQSRSKRFTALSSRGLPWLAPITSIIYLVFVVKNNSWYSFFLSVHCERCDDAALNFVDGFNSGDTDDCEHDDVRFVYSR